MGFTPLAGLVMARRCGDLDPGALHRLRAAIAAMAAAMGGVDAVAFTGGVGKHAAGLRAEACGPLRWMGVALDGAANAAAGTAPGWADADVSAAGSAVRVLVVRAREELQIATECAGVLAPV